jgi:hypothetical protein
MVCAEKMRLIDRVAAATSALIAVTSTLSSKTGVEFREALMASKASRAECATARRALADHRPNIAASAAWQRNIFEMVRFLGEREGGREATAEELDRWAASFPIER